MGLEKNTYIYKTIGIELHDDCRLRVLPVQRLKERRNMLLYDIMSVLSEELLYRRQHHEQNKHHNKQRQHNGVDAQQALAQATILGLEKRD